MYIGKVLRSAEEASALITAELLQCSLRHLQSLFPLNPGTQPPSLFNALPPSNDQRTGQVPAYVYLLLPVPTSLASVCVCVCVCVCVFACPTSCNGMYSRFQIKRLWVQFPTIMVIHVFLLFLALLLALLLFSWVTTHRQCMPEYVV